MLESTSYPVPTEAYLRQQIIDKVNVEWAQGTPLPMDTATAKPLSDLTATLTERGHRYGKFTGHAQVTQDLKTITAEHLATRTKHLPADMEEALDMIYHKIGRIVNGDHNYADSWIDIAGYAKLVSDRLEGIAR